MHNIVCVGIEIKFLLMVGTLQNLVKCCDDLQVLKYLCFCLILVYYSYINCGDLIPSHCGFNL